MLERAAQDRDIPLEPAYEAVGESAAWRLRLLEMLRREEPTKSPSPADQLELRLRPDHDLDPLREAGYLLETYRDEDGRFVVRIASHDPRYGRIYAVSCSRGLSDPYPDALIQLDHQTLDVVHELAVQRGGRPRFWSDQSELEELIAAATAILCVPDIR